MDDLISRQAAIDVVEKWFGKIGLNPDICIDGLISLPSAQPEPIKINIDDFNKEDLERFKKELGNTPITVLPSAQPEPLTDKEQRIFLAAMGREEKVCKYKDSLVKTCHEIIRKVKGALWT